MKPRLIGETWRKYPTETSKQKATYGLFECQYCGKEFECQISSVKNKATRSCGCQKCTGLITHGVTKHKGYQVHNDMMRRCYNERTSGYQNYGGRGLTVCEEWLDVVGFISWFDSNYIEGFTLDRIDNDKGYTPDNCRFADKVTQAINRRMKKGNTSGYVGVSYHKGTGRWSTSVGVNYETLYIGLFPTIEEAVQARDNYIIENNLPHKLSTEYKKE